MDSEENTELDSEENTERWPLLGSRADAEVGETDYPPVSGWRDTWELFAAESKKLWRIGAPIAFNIICLYGFNSTTQIFVGHIGNLELSAVAIALNVVSTFAFGFLLGMGSALETLCGQAFGAGQVELLGVYMQRSWIILLATSVLMLPIYIFAGPVLRLIGQKPQIADLAGKFALAVYPQTIALTITFPSQKFLQAQSKVNVLALIGLASLLMHVAMLALFIYVFGWGLAGAAAAFDISAWINALGQVCYIMGWCREGWRGFSWAAFKDILAFVRLSFASAIMLWLEIWYTSILTVLTGHLANAEIAVGSLSICMNIIGWEGTIFIGLNAAISIRVSNELGAGRPCAAKYAMVVVLVESLTISLLCMIIVLVTRNYFAIIFTGDKAMQQAVAKLAYLLGITVVFNSIQQIISGVAIGGGWQTLVAYINLGCYFIFGLPLGIIIGYVVKFGVEGIWLGMLLGVLLQLLILLFIIWKTDWNAEACQAAERVRLWGG